MVAVGLVHFIRGQGRASLGVEGASYSSGCASDLDLIDSRCGRYSQIQLCIKGNDFQGAVDWLSFCANHNRR